MNVKCGWEVLVLQYFQLGDKEEEKGLKMWKYHREEIGGTA